MAAYVLDECMEEKITSANHSVGECCVMVCGFYAVVKCGMSISSLRCQMWSGMPEKIGEVCKRRMER